MKISGCKEGTRSYGKPRDQHTRPFFSLCIYLGPVLRIDWCPWCLECILQPSAYLTKILVTRDWHLGKADRSHPLHRFVAHRMLTHFPRDPAAFMQPTLFRHFWQPSEAFYFLVPSRLLLAGRMITVLLCSDSGKCRKAYIHTIPPLPSARELFEDGPRLAVFVRNV
jgi:hypothetical protein